MECLEDRTVLSPFAPTIFTDSNTTVGGISLRDAIIAVNADPGTATDTIKLSTGTYQLTIGGALENASFGDLNITRTTGNVIIQGNGTTGPCATIIDQLTADRVFQLFPGTVVTFQNLVITGGNAHDNGTTAGTTAEGGGILDNGGNLNLTNVVIDGNTAVGDNGASGGNGQDAQGGGLYINGGSVKIVGSTLSHDKAQGGNGGNGGNGGGGDHVIVADSDLNRLVVIQGAGGGVGGVGGTGGNGEGGGLYSSGGSVSINNSTFTNDTALGGTGGTAGTESGNTVSVTDCDVAVSTVITQGASGGGVGGTGGNGEGGGLYSSGGPVSINYSTFTNDTAQGGSGGTGGTGGSPTVTLTNVDCPSIVVTQGAGGVGGVGGSGGSGEGGGLYIG
ncbi:MAG TPA: hypothetical protein VKF17_06980, partial [Isosphaeraceae bacterium]|nr:hypothetical protein [Isosphaeraceae bacterium]